jgi:hypothetical protein
MKFQAPTNNNHLDVLSAVEICPLPYGNQLACFLMIATSRSVMRTPRMFTRTKPCGPPRYHIRIVFLVCVPMLSIWPVYSVTSRNPKNGPGPSRESEPTAPQGYISYTRAEEHAVRRG